MKHKLLILPKDEPEPTGKGYLDERIDNSKRPFSKRYFKEYPTKQDIVHLLKWKNTLKKHMSSIPSYLNNYRFSEHVKEIDDYIKNNLTNT